MTPREMEAKLREMDRETERLRKEFTGRCDQLERKLLTEIAEIKQRPELYTPAQREPIIPPEFPDSLRDLGLEEPDGAG